MYCCQQSLSTPYSYHLFPQRYGVINLASPSRAGRHLGIYSPRLRGNAIDLCPCPPPLSMDLIPCHHWCGMAVFAICTRRDLRAEYSLRHFFVRVHTLSMSLVHLSVVDLATNPLVKRISLACNSLHDVSPPFVRTRAFDSTLCSCFGPTWGPQPRLFLTCCTYPVRVVWFC